MLCLNAQKPPRIQLLLRLENDRWKYCNECWNLHPHSTWRALRVNWRLLFHQIRYNYRYKHPEQICDVLYAGEADLCPCLTITFRDKLFLIEKCRQVKQGKKEYYNDFNNHPNFGTLDKKAIWHICSFTDHPFAKVQVTTFLAESPDATSSLCVIGINLYSTHKDNRKTSMTTTLHSKHLPPG
jgi:hypothetical protein